MFKACAGCTSNSCNAEHILFQAQHVAASCSITSCCISYLSKSLPYAKNNIRLPRAKARLKSRQEFTVNALGRLCLLQLGKLRPQRLAFLVLCQGDGAQLQVT
jgi:hypothetical protein